MENKRDKLYSLLGDLPDRNYPISVELISVEESDFYYIENLILDLNGIEKVPAYFTRPKDAPKPYPTMLFCHSHGGMYGMGKFELIKPAYYGYAEPYAQAMAKRGIACLAIDHWGFGQRYTRRETEIFKSFLWKGQVMWGMMVFDSIRGLDYLMTRDDVDTSRIGAIGMSMGSTMSIWVTALDERIKTCVDICCLTDFEELEKEKNLDGHGIYYYVPSLTKYFDMADINSLIAPRPHLSTAGIYDDLTPEKGLYKIEAKLKEIYKNLGAEDNFILKTYPCEHVEPKDMRDEILKFIYKTL
jgi:cephalosporin-C deacetylase-like acetyl esterase